jgi:hypothetical protein
LVSLGVLHDGGRLPFDGEHYRALALLQLLDEVAGAAAKSRQRLDVFGDIEQGAGLLIAPNKVPLTILLSRASRKEWHFTGSFSPRQMRRAHNFLYPQRDGKEFHRSFKAGARAL